MDLQNSFKFVAVVDGATLNGYLRVDGAPLVQRFRPGSDIYVPDFTDLEESDRPTVVAVIMNMSDGSVLVPNTLAFKYNDVELTFGSDGLSTNVGWEGTFKRLTSYSVQIGEQSYPMTALRVMKNLASATNVDNDRIKVSGTVELQGSSIAFNELSVDVSIMESTDNVYDVILLADNGGIVSADNPSTTIYAKLYQAGQLISDTSGYSFRWFKIENTGDTALGTSSSQVITANDIDSALKVRCDVYKGSDLLCSEFIDITDVTDPYYIQINITGVVGQEIRRGEIATVTPVVVERDGTPVPDLITTWQFRIVNNSGEEFKLQNHPAATFSGPNCQVTYTDVVDGDGAVIGYIGGTY